MKKKRWEPAKSVPREQIIKDAKKILAMPDIPVKKTEEIIRIRTLEMDWDIGAVVYGPEDQVRIPVAPDGK
ncbi:MAG: hypothetical protein AAB222_04490, partial [Candidatus Binatota bacterium]